MRKSRSRVRQAISVLFLSCVAAACTPHPSQINGLGSAQQSFDSGKYDQAVKDADKYLRDKPKGGDSAAAYYLKGRSYEEMTAANPREAQQNLNAARTAYVQGLRLNPDRALKARLQAAVANVAYHQEDYSTALQQWSAAYEPLDTESLKPWVLYRIGLCQQRLGKFVEADRSFEAVKKNYPGTPAATRAQQHQGARQFYVQLGVFSTAQAAEQSAASARSAGVTATVVTQAGKQVVRVGPAQTYAQAKQLKQRVAGIQPDAIIVP